MPYLPGCRPASYETQFGTLLFQDKHDVDDGNTVNGNVDSTTFIFNGGVDPAFAGESFTADKVNRTVTIHLNDGKGGFTTSVYKQESTDRKWKLQSGPELFDTPENRARNENLRTGPQYRGDYHEVRVGGRYLQLRDGDFLTDGERRANGEIIPPTNDPTTTEYRDAMRFYVFETPGDHWGAHTVKDPVHRSPKMMRFELYPHFQSDPQPGANWEVGDSNYDTNFNREYTALGLKLECPKEPKKEDKSDWQWNDPRTWFD